MQIELPPDAESLVKTQAESAGFDRVEDYLLSLVHQDQQCRRFEVTVAADPRIESIALEGINSGPVTPLDMQSIRDEYRQRLGNAE